MFMCSNCHYSAKHMRMARIPHLLYFFCALFTLLSSFCSCYSAFSTTKEDPSIFAVIIQSSQYWFNYRHVSNALSMYQVLKDHGVPDSHIVFFNALDCACDSRNLFPGQQFASVANPRDLFKDVEVDYRGLDVNHDSIMEFFCGGASVPSRKMNHSRLNAEENIVSSSKLLHSSQENTNLLVYMTGHGGPGFLKIQDHEALSSSDIADIFQCLQGRYKKALFLADTCKAGSLLTELDNIEDMVAVVSSKDGENSYAAVQHLLFGMHLVDGFSHELSNYAAERNLRRDSLADFVEHMMKNEEKVLSEIEYKVFPGKFIGNDLHRVPLSDFFVKKRRAEELSMTEFWKRDFEWQTHMQEKASETLHIRGGVSVMDTLKDWTDVCGSYDSYDAYSNERSIHVPLLSAIHSWCRNIRIPYHDVLTVFLSLWLFVTVSLFLRLSISLSRHTK
eukprot:TRINITY_DN2073_c0_g1_i2.p1 TRINITY_DN2073_c0_g1~~TRINITY_DN2073_c0_g1_i2.p1  ORF type:complete len:447 (-),score=86.07 TRINITY_DN2073_c0_g1_i2:19-1359(-)